MGSAQLITDNEGKEYERIEYTPYGEYWIEKRAPENKTLPFKFTGKERDEETGLYYYGARYTDPDGESVFGAAIIGGLISAGIDYAFQVGGNYL